MGKNIAIGTGVLGTATLAGGYAAGMNEDRLYEEFKDLINKMDKAQTAGKTDEALKFGQQAQQKFQSLNKTLRFYLRNQGVRQIRDMGESLTPEINALKSTLGKEAV